MTLIVIIVELMFVCECSETCCYWCTYNVWSFL